MFAATDFPTRQVFYAMTRLLQIVRRAAVAWWDDDSFRVAAVLAFYTIFSLSPLLVISVAVAGLVFGQEEARSRLATELDALIGPEGGNAVAEVVKRSEFTSGGPLAITVGVVTLLIGSTVLFAELQTALNKMWGVKADPERAGGLWRILYRRLLSFGLVLAVAFLLLVSLAVSAALSAAEDRLVQWLPGVSFGWRLANLATSFALVAAVFTLVYRFLPDVKIAWRDAAVGGISTSLLFNAGKYLIGVYLGRSGLASTYGQAGSFVVFLIWVFYSALICLYGAELTQAYARERGSRIQPDDHAVRR